MLKKFFAISLLALWLPASASAALMQLEYSGTFSADSTLGGVALYI